MLHELKDAGEKIGISALLALISHITLSQVASGLAIVYTTMQIYNLIKTWKKK